MVSHVCTSNTSKIHSLKYNKMGHCITDKNLQHISRQVTTLMFETKHSTSKSYLLEVELMYYLTE